MITLLPFGLNNGKLTSINEVSSGLECDCICPSCSVSLIARKGKDRVHHFAHEKGENCEGAIETALHLAAKEIIEERKSIRLPELIGDDNEFAYHKPFVIVKPTEVTFESVELEKSIGGFIPDVVGVIGETELYIEVAVTHFVDDEKQRKVEERGVSMIEINLQGLKDGFTQDELEGVVIDSTRNKRWIYNSKFEELYDNQMRVNRSKQRRKRQEFTNRDQGYEKEEEYF